MNIYRHGDLGDDSILYATVNALNILYQNRTKVESKETYNSLVTQIYEGRSCLDEIQNILCYGSDSAFDIIDQYPELRIECLYKGSVCCWSKIPRPSIKQTVIIVQYPNRSWSVIPQQLQDSLALNVTQAHALSIS
jgi:hypothetical protein